MIWLQLKRKSKFQFTHPVRGAACSVGKANAALFISIHAPRAGCSAAPQGSAAAGYHFNSRTPCGVQLTPISVGSGSKLFQFTHPVRGAAQLDKGDDPHDEISIHAPRAGCSRLMPKTSNGALHFNSRTPCGVQLDRRTISVGNVDFNSRTPCGVQREIRFAAQIVTYFNSRTPCGVQRPPLRGPDPAPPHFNSRTPCGVQHRLFSGTNIQFGFQFTHPVRGAARHSSAGQFQMRNFNSRTPCGVQPNGRRGCRVYARFQFTHPVRGAAQMGDSIAQTGDISIHAPRAGCSKP